MNSANSRAISFPWFHTNSARRWHYPVFAELLRDFYQKMQARPNGTNNLESITGNTRRMAGMMEEILILSRWTRQIGLSTACST
jgi:hypothetical protein